MTSSNEFFDQFIDDYFAEAEEHLGTARRVLLELEAGAGVRIPDERLLRELLRSLHTLKGLSGMVGDAGAERTAHALEESLRATESAAAPLGATLMDALFAGVELLERCVAARRAGTPPPDLESTIAQLGRVTGAPEPPSGPGPSMPAAPAVPHAPAVHGADIDDPAEVIYHFEFTPSVALTERGVGVDAMRSRLRTLGTLLDVKPRMMDGAVIFDFWVSTPPERHPDEAWAADGLRWLRIDASVPRLPTVAEPEPAAANVGPVGAPATTPLGPTSAPSVARVELSRLDAVMRLVGDLVVSRSRMEGLLRQSASGDLAGIRDGLEETSAAMERQIRQLRESVMRIRLVPIGEVFERLRFTARDAIRESGKQVALAFHGQGTEIDKLVVDRMLEPLLHLVRNAVTHGIEAPAERIARGKPAQGTLTLRAAASGDRIVIDVEDDGGGIDVEAVARRARASGLLDADETLGDAQLLDVLCAPGFSTRAEADRTSGRGVGMEVVRSTVRALAGELTLETAPGLGTRFVIDLPLTLMILDALIVDIGGQQMAVPQPALREILQVERSAVVAFENNEVISYRGGVLPILSLARIFGLPSAPSTSLYLLVVGSEASPVGLAVDRLHGLREIVVHPVPDPLVAVPGVGGATELSDGRVSLILDTAALVRLAYDQRDRHASTRSSASRPQSSLAVMHDASSSRN